MREVVPRRRAGVRRVEDAAMAARREGPQRPGKGDGMGRGPELVGNDAHLLALAHQAQHGGDEIAAARGIDPGRPHDQRRGVELGCGDLAVVLGPAIGAERVRRRARRIGLVRGAIEDEVGRDMRKGRPGCARCAGQGRHGVDVDPARRRLVALGPVDSSIGSGVEHDGRPHVGDDARNGVGVGDVEIALGGSDDGDARGRGSLQGAAELARTAGDQDGHANTSASASDGATASLADRSGAAPSSGQSMASVGSSQRTALSAAGS